MPFLQGDLPSDWRDAHYTQFNGVELYYSQRCVLTHEFKYVYNGFDRDELYDLRADPHETRNIADNPTYTGIKRGLVRQMWRFAAQENDIRLFNPYSTVALAPWGPGDAFSED
jgi:arylsulfatase A-like enzyme